MAFDLSATANIKALFEIPDEVCYLNCAGISPQLRSVTEAGYDGMRMKVSPWKLTRDDWFSRAETLRKLVAGLLGTSHDRIALIPAVSYGIATAAMNLPVSTGEKIVLLHRQFPSNVYAWHELAKKRGGRVVTVQRGPEKSWTEAIEEEIDKNTAIVAIPQCHWTDGGLVDLKRVGERAREAGAALVVDVSQSLGANPIDVSVVQPDFLVSVGYKWLLGPYGLGYLYASPRWCESGAPLEQSWLARKGCEDFSSLVDYVEEYRSGARRFDMGEFPQFALIPMAISGLRQVREWGVAEIQRALSKLTERIMAMSIRSGYEVLAGTERCGHMIGIRFPSGIPAGILDALERGKVYVSVRGDSIRVSPYLYNDEKDVDRLFNALRSARS